jgi:hypothetical protein
MNKHIALLSLPSSAFAHPGHLGPADHGDVTHALLSLGIAMILLTGTWMILKANNRRKVPVRVRKDHPNG